MAIDISFNFKPHPLTGDLVTLNRSQAIRQSLVNLIRTSYYARGFNVELGCNIDSMLFELIDNLTAQQLKTNIENTVLNFEPRVVVLDVEVYQNSDHDISLVLIYQEQNSPVEQNLVIDLKIIR